MYSPINPPVELIKTVDVYLEAANSKFMKFQATISTASEINLIHPNLVNKLGLSIEIYNEAPGKRFSKVSRKCTKTCLVFNSIKTRVFFLIDKNKPLILGLPWLKANQVTIDCKNQSLYIPSAASVSNNTNHSEIVSKNGQGTRDSLDDTAKKIKEEINSLVESQLKSLMTNQGHNVKRAIPNSKEIKPDSSKKNEKEVKQENGVKVIKDTTDIKDTKNTKDTKTSKDTKDAKVTTDNKDSKETKETKETKDTKDSKMTKVTKEEEKKKDSKPITVVKTAATKTTTVPPKKADPTTTAKTGNDKSSSIPSKTKDENRKCECGLGHDHGIEDGENGDSDSGDDEYYRTTQTKQGNILLTLFPDKFLDQIKEDQKDFGVTVPHLGYVHNGIIFNKKDCVIVPRLAYESKRYLLMFYHGFLQSAHLGAKGLCRLLTDIVVWDNMREEITQFANSCSECKKITHFVPYWEPPK